MKKISIRSIIAKYTAYLENALNVFLPSYWKDDLQELVDDLRNVGDRESIVKLKVFLYYFNCLQAFLTLEMTKFFNAIKPKEIRKTFSAIQLSESKNSVKYWENRLLKLGLISLDNPCRDTDRSELAIKKDDKSTLNKEVSNYICEANQFTEAKIYVSINVRSLALMLCLLCLILCSFSIWTDISISSILRLFQVQILLAIAVATSLISGGERVSKFVHEVNYSVHWMALSASAFACANVLIFVPVDALSNMNLSSFIKNLLLLIGIGLSISFFHSLLNVIRAIDRSKIENRHQFFGSTFFAIAFYIIGLALWLNSQWIIGQFLQVLSLIALFSGIVNYIQKRILHNDLSIKFKRRQ